MKAYLINPEAREVSEVDVRTSQGDIDVTHIYELMQCEAIEAVNPISAGHDLIYLDEHGKLRPNDYFVCRLWPYEALAGRALWVGSGNEGRTTKPKMLLEYVAAHISWGVR